jgi:hypothetical protein
MNDEASLHSSTVKPSRNLSPCNGRITVTLSQDNESATEPAVIDDSANRPALVREIIIGGDDEERLVTKIAPGDLDIALAGTITHQHRQLIEDRRKRGQA